MGTTRDPVIDVRNASGPGEALAGIDLTADAGRVRVAGHHPVRQPAAVRADVLAHLPDIARVPPRRSGR